MGYGDYLSPWLFQHDSFGRPWMPLNMGGPSATKDGGNAPFVQSDADLDRMRGLAQWLTTKNKLAIGVTSTLRNYTIKHGYEWDTRPTPGNEDNARAVLLAREVKAFLDGHDKVNKLKKRERSHFVRAVRDGDTMTRHFARGDGMTLVRPVRADQLRDPGGRGPHASFGIETDEDDVETALCYHVTYNGGGSYEEVPADSACFYKRNVDEEVKRGLSDFYSAGEGLDDVYKLLRNMSKGGGVLAALAWIEEYESATRDQMMAAAGNKFDLNVPKIDHPLTGRPVNYQHYEPGTVHTVQKGKKYLPPPLAVNTGNFISIVQACLRAIGVRWSMPEYMVSGDASNANYSSTLVSGSPFVNAVECEQYDIGGELFLRWRWIAVRNAVRAGLIRAGLEELQALVDIHYTPPLVAVANELEQAQIDHMDIGAGVMSIPTRRARRKLDDEQERKNNKEEPPTRVTGKVADVDPQGNPTGAERGGGGALQPAEGGPFPAAEGVTEADLAGWLREAVEEGATLEEAAGWLEEARAQGAARKVGEVWQGPSGRWFTRRQDGRTVPAKAPGGKGGGGKAGGGKKDGGAEGKGGKGKPEPKAKPTVDEAHAHFERLAKGGATPQAVEEMAASWQALTVPQLTELQKRLEVKLKGRPLKADRVEALKGRARQLAAEAGAGKGPVEFGETLGSEAEARRFAGTLRSALERAAGGEAPAEWCADAALVVHQFFPDSQWWHGEFQTKGGPESHTVSKVGDWFIDVSADQFGHHKVVVARELDKGRYRGFQKAPWVDGGKITAEDERAKKLVGELVKGGVKAPDRALQDAGFTGKDALGREWRDGELVAKREEGPKPKAPPAAPKSEAPRVKIDLDLHDEGKEVMRRAVDQARANRKLSPEQRVEYFHATQKVLKGMSPKAAGRVAQHLPKGPEYAASTEDVKQAAIDAVKDRTKKDALAKSREIGGFYTKGRLVVDGAYSEQTRQGFAAQGEKNRTGTTVGLHAHELAHAIDGPDHELSRTAEWQAAFLAEIRGGRLTKYAATKPEEGWAEFGRLVLAGEHKLESVRKALPQCYAAWERMGLLPGAVRESLAEAAPGAVSLPEMFGARVELDDRGGHADILLEGAGDE